MIQRREFIAGLGGAVAWPLVARAQQRAMPVVGLLDSGSAESNRRILGPFRQGLGEAGYVEGKNLAVEYRWADDRYDRLPALAADLVRRGVKVIAVPASTPASLAAKAATSAIPIVFGVNDDPVKLGLVASLARPGGNATGVNFFVGELVAKRLGLLRELVPAAARVAVLVNPDATRTTETVVKDVGAAARDLGLQVRILNASTIREIDAAFTNLVRERVEAVFVGPDPFFNTRRVQLALLAARHAVPAAYSVREYVEAGGLMSYGTSLVDMWHQVGVYTGRILEGVQPRDLPVVQSTRFELVINLSAANALGVDVPPTLLAIADEVIE
jgi:putative ABC transport system substrate-binding protein